MTKQKTIQNVTVKRIGNSIELHVPNTMTGAKLVAWKEANKEEIAKFTEETTTEEKEDVPSRSLAT